MLIKNFVLCLLFLELISVAVTDCNEIYSGDEMEPDIEIGSTAPFDDFWRIKDECREFACNIECSATDLDIINGEMNQFIENLPSKCNPGVDLQLTHIEYPDQKLYPGWLNITHNLISLTLSFSNIKKIEKNSFSHGTIKNIIHLNIKQIQIFELNDQTLNGLNSLKSLRLSTLPIKITEKNFLDPVKNSLKELVIHELKWFPVDLYNYTGCVSLPHLKTLIVSSLVPIIKRNYFQGLSSLVLLKLVDCQIHTIEVGSFDSLLKTILEIDLRWNQLKMFKGALDQLVIKPSIRIFIGDDNCDFMSTELSTLYRKNSNAFVEINCKSLKTIQTSTYAPFSDVPIEPSGYINCVDDILSMDNSEELLVYHEDVRIDIIRLDNGSTQVILKDVTSDHFLILFDSEDNEYSISCLYSSTSVFLLDGLDDDKAYTLCAMNKYKTTLSPFDCRPYYNEPRNQEVNRMWLSEDDKAITISSVIIAYLACTGIGCLLGYYILKQNPNLLKGSSGVIVVRSMSDVSMASTTTVLDGDDVANKDSDPYNDYADIQGDMPSGYESAITPSRFEIIKWKLDEVERKRNSDCSEISPYVTAPTLPLVEVSNADEKLENENKKIDSCSSENYI